MSGNPYQIAYERERKARKIAEKLMDEKTREVYSTLNMIESQFNNLQQKQKDLEAANSNLKAAHKQLVQSEKMASIGQLAAGVAHEINNPVGFVLSNLETLKEYSEALRLVISRLSELASSRQEAIDELFEEADMEYIDGDLPLLLSESIVGMKRVREIVDGLRSFSRVSDAELKPEDLNALLENTVKVTWNELKYRAKVCFNLGDIPRVRCNSGQLSQVFVNLLVNAAHALREQEHPGHIEIVTSNHRQEIRVDIRDNGCGIPEHIQARIFDPFFTTKPIGVGTGLGLSVSHGLVEKHHGRIELKSVPGKGTTFSIFLPLDPAVHHQESASSESERTGK